MAGGIALWTAGTVGHIVLSALWARRLAWSRTRDEWLFIWTLSVTGGLVVAVHAARLAGGLGLASGLAALLAWHAGAGFLCGRRTSDEVPATPAPNPATLTERVLEAAALVVLTAIALTWSVDASAAPNVSGTDAAHYHVPVAVNIALGAGLFHLPPTPHLYPMSASSLVAWFILPTRDALIIDLAMLPPFALLVASLAYAFRLVTDRSGLAWMTWPVLALFGTRLFRASSLVSADLLFAAALSALVALLLCLLKGGRRSVGLPLAGLATGLLVGSKFTGIPAALLLWTTALVLRWLTGQRPPATSARRQAGALALALVLAVGAGGIWLIHNWMLWGSPIAPTGLTIAGVEIFAGVAHAPTDYLSVLGDQQRNRAYPLGSRLSHYIRTWLGAWYLLSLLPIVVLGVDAVFPLRRSIARDMRRAVLVLIVASALPVGWLLVGAPWTSLEWTKGFSLRYVLPYWALFVLLAMIGCFPTALPWYRSGRNAAAAGLAIAAAGLWLFAATPHAGDPPRLALWSLPTAVVAWMATAVLHRVPGRMLIGAGAVLMVTLATAAGLTARAHTARSSAQAQPQHSTNPVRALLAAAMSAEQTRGRACHQRRIFLITRVDEPLEFQPDDYRTLVFYAARDVATSRRVEAMGPCDYIVSSRPVMATDKGQRLVSVINRNGRTVELAEIGAFVLLGYE